MIAAPIIRLISLLTFFAGACVTVKCHPGDTRCNATGSPEACLASGEWRQYENCADVAKQSGGAWKCCDTIRAGAQCLPMSMCHE